MTAAAPPVTLPPSPRRRPNGWWGMLLLVATESTLFLVLLASYFYVRFKSQPHWPPGEIEKPTLAVPLVMTFLLTASSIPMIRAERAIRKGNRARLVSGLIASLTLGTLFLLVQAHEYLEKMREFAPDGSAYGSLFFTITGLHGSHVIAGLLLTLWTTVHAWRGRFTATHHTAVQTTALYWHFVHFAWLAVFFSLYLSPRL